MYTSPIINVNIDVAHELVVNGNSKFDHKHVFYVLCQNSYTHLRIAKSLSKYFSYGYRNILFCVLTCILIIIISGFLSKALILNYTLLLEYCTTTFVLFLLKTLIIEDECVTAVTSYLLQLLIFNIRFSYKIVRTICQRNFPFQLHRCEGLFYFLIYFWFSYLVVFMVIS